MFAHILTPIHANIAITGCPLLAMQRLNSRSAASLIDDDLLSEDSAQLSSCVTQHSTQFPFGKQEHLPSVSKVDLAIIADYRKE